MRWKIVIPLYLACLTSVSSFFYVLDEARPPYIDFEIELGLAILYVTAALPMLIFGTELM